jgi:hypothetical protein
VPIEIAQLIVGTFETYALAGLLFAIVFLPRAVVRLSDGRAAVSESRRR